MLVAVVCYRMHQVLYFDFYLLQNHCIHSEPTGLMIHGSKSFNSEQGKYKQRTLLQD